MIRRPPRSTSMTHAVPNRRSSALPAARDEGPEQKPEPPVGAPAPDRPVSGRRWHRDLQRLRPTPLAVHIAAGPWATLAASAPRPWGRDIRWALQVDPGSPLAAALPAWRSEEHTSELQSLMRISYAVFCLKK